MRQGEENYRKQRGQERNRKKPTFISHYHPPFCLCRPACQRQIAVTLAVCILEQSSVMNASWLADKNACIQYKPKPHHAVDALKLLNQASV